MDSKEYKVELIYEDDSLSDIRFYIGDKELKHEAIREFGDSLKEAFITDDIGTYIIREIKKLNKIHN